MPRFTSHSLVSVARLQRVYLRGRGRNCRRVSCVPLEGRKSFLCSPFIYLPLAACSRIGMYNINKRVLRENGALIITRGC